ncbi:MAG: hypothetical protein M3018_00420 [Actinomycetota bacterium]|nr:hypothetical protein [Actinomycetota bacterium]
MTRALAMQPVVPLVATALVATALVVAGCGNGREADEPSRGWQHGSADPGSLPDAVHGPRRDPASLHPLVLAGSLSGVGAGFAMTLGGVAGRCGDMCGKRYTEQLVAAAPERWGRSTWRRQTGLLVLDVAHGAAAYRREWPASLLRDERY